MVCSKCEKKLSKVAATEKWRPDNIDKAGKVSSGRVVNENKILSKGKHWSPYSSKCTICKAPLQQGKYCQKCAYSKGICALCGKQVLDTSAYKQSTA